MSSNTETIWDDCPLFAPSASTIPSLQNSTSAEHVSSAIGALSHLLYDEESPQEASELLRDEGNRHFKRGKNGYNLAIEKYNLAISAAADVPLALAPCLLNRAMAEYKLGNFGRALRDVDHSLCLQPDLVKTHYWGLLCALRLGKFDIGQRHADAGLKLCASADTAQNRRDARLLKVQKQALEQARQKRAQYEGAKSAVQEARQAERQAVESMLRKKGITMAMPLFSQQRRYAVTNPSLKEGEWFWPVLLVYPEQVASPGMGDQSDYLQEVSENAKVGDIIELVFGGGNVAAWDLQRRYAQVDRLEVRYRGKWSMKREEADSDDEMYFCGSSLPKEDLGGWVAVNREVTLGDVMKKRDYLTPLFPVLYVVPRHVGTR